MLFAVTLQFTMYIHFLRNQIKWKKHSVRLNTVYDKKHSPRSSKWNSILFYMCPKLSLAQITALSPPIPNCAQGRITYQHKTIQTRSLKAFLINWNIFLFIYIGVYIGLIREKCYWNWGRNNLFSRLYILQLLFTFPRPFPAYHLSCRIINDVHQATELPWLHWFSVTALYCSVRNMFRHYFRKIERTTLFLLLPVLHASEIYAPFGSFPNSLRRQCCPESTNK
jgi:hypothetical protein